MNDEARTTALAALIVERCIGGHDPTIKIVNIGHDGNYVFGMLIEGRHFHFVVKVHE